jgi:bifunctional non-homologous end joining protein LigD
VSKDAVEEKLELTHPEKILIPKGQITKQDLALYYLENKDWILPHISDRPLAVLRCPDGISEKAAKTCFFQKRLQHPNKAIHTAKVKAEVKKEKEEVMYIDSPGGLVQLVQMGCLEFHMRGGFYDDINHPNLIVFDFDPGPNVKWQMVKDAALELKEILASLELESYLKTSAGKGLHVHLPIAPLYNWDQAKEFARSVCRLMEEKNPKLYTTTISKSEREGKIFLDYLRNGYGATAVVPYSVRARDFAPVALPLTWRELKTLSSSTQFPLKDMPKIMRKRRDPWPGYFERKQKISLFS